MTHHAAGAGLPIEPMELADLDGVYTVELRSFSHPWTRDAFEQELRANPLAHYLVARAGTTIAGYVGMWLILDEAHVTNVAVDPAYRGRYLGERLLRHLIDYARGMGATRMTLEVRVSNYVAQNLYTKLGFVGSGRRPGYYSDTGEDALIMWKDPL